MKRLAILCALIVLCITPTVLAKSHHHQDPSPRQDHHQQTPPPVVPPPVTQPPVTGTTMNISNVTFYGYPDNSPPGTAIAYPIIHSKAGGSGTFLDPLTFATKSTFPKGTVLYVPYIQKYVINEDECASCGASHIDIWMPSNGDFNKQVLACENTWTRNNMPVIVGPPNNLPVGPDLFDTSAGICL